MTAMTNFDAAIEKYSNKVNNSFSTAASAIPDPVIDAKTAESVTMNLLTQLSGAARMQFDQRNRAGFDAVVDLMQTTATAAASVSAKLATVLHLDDAGQPAQADYQFISELQQTLDVLSRLSPSAVWTGVGGTAGSG